MVYYEYQYGMLTLELPSYLLEIPIMLMQYSVISDWLFNRQSKVLQAHWFILEIDEKATWSINMPY